MKETEEGKGKKKEKRRLFQREKTSGKERRNEWKQETENINVARIMRKMSHFR